MTINSLSAVNPATSSLANLTRSGTVDSSQNGPGTFTSILSSQNGVKTIDTTVNFANGQSFQRDTTITKNANGSRSVTITNTSGTGAVTTRQETITANGDGGRSITGTLTQANGAVDALSGTIVKADGGTDTTLDLTNAQGQTATDNIDKTVNGNATTYSQTGSTFSGQSFANTSVWTLLA
jgi:hypothetical protein